MMYNNNIIYAWRVIGDYLLFKKYSENEFTLACSVLLNVFSAILPDGTLLLDVGEVNHLPGLEGQTINEYVNDIRNGLAHKTNINFQNYEIDERIAEIQLSSNSGRIYRFNFNDLSTIIDFFTIKIKELVDEEKLE